MIASDRPLEPLKSHKREELGKIVDTQVPHSRFI